MQIKRLAAGEFPARAFSSSGYEPLRAPKEFTRSAVDQVGAKKTASPAEEKAEPFPKRFMHAAERIKTVVAACLAPGESMPIEVDGEMKILHRSESRNAIVLQSPKDVLSSRRNAFCLATDPTGKIMMGVDDWLVMSSKSSRYPEACKQLAGLQSALGIPFEKKQAASPNMPAEGT